MKCFLKTTKTGKTSNTGEAVKTPPLKAGSVVGAIQDVQTELRGLLKKFANAPVPAGGGARTLAFEDSEIETLRKLLEALESARQLLEKSNQAADPGEAKLCLSSSDLQVLFMAVRGVIGNSSAAREGPAPVPVSGG